MLNLVVTDDLDSLHMYAKKILFDDLAAGRSCLYVGPEKAMEKIQSHFSSKGKGYLVLVVPDGDDGLADEIKEMIKTHRFKTVLIEEWGSLSIQQRNRLLNSLSKGRIEAYIFLQNITEVDFNFVANKHINFDTIELKLEGENGNRVQLVTKNTSNWERVKYTQEQIGVFL